MVYIVPVYSDATQGESEKKGKREKAVRKWVSCRCWDFVDFWYFAHHRCFPFLSITWDITLNFLSCSLRLVFVCTSLTSTQSPSCAIIPKAGEQQVASTAFLEAYLHPPRRKSGIASQVRACEGAPFRSPKSCKIHNPNSCDLPEYLLGLIRLV